MFPKDNKQILINIHRPIPKFELTEKGCEIDVLSNHNDVNFWNNKVKVVEMQSEAGAIALVHGALQAGELSTTFTASQGLLLMIPTLYKMAGEMLPGVIHVATHALSIFGDHQDIYSVRSTGVCMLASANPQDAYHMAMVAHLSAIKSSLPFINFFDGFRTSHEISKVKLVDYNKIKELIDEKALQDFRNRAMSNENYNTRGTAQNDDIYFQNTEVRNKNYIDSVSTIANYMDEVSKITGYDYKPFNYYGDKDATDVIVDEVNHLIHSISELLEIFFVQKNLVFLERHLRRLFPHKLFFTLCNRKKKLILTVTLHI